MTTAPTRNPRPTRFAPLLVGFLMLPGGGAQGFVAADPARSDGEAVEAAAELDARAFPVDRGEGELLLQIPREEELVFQVHISLAMIEATPGTVSMSSKVEPYREALLLAAPVGKESEKREQARLQIHAKGGYALYSMDSTIETLWLPQEWPRVVSRHSQAGSENRRREILLGLLDGEPTSSYRKDTTTGAPPGTRIWREPSLRAVPENAVDMLSAVYIVRTMIEEGLDDVRFPVVDKSRLWELTLRRGGREQVETHAGKFLAVEILMSAERVLTDEERERYKDRDPSDFKGLFGLHGTIGLWVEEKTGIPVRIQGDLPVGFLDLGVDIVLDSFRGVPVAFSPLTERGGEEGGGD